MNRKRRQFLANLLFAGGALTLTLASLHGACAAEVPIEEGWVLPKDLEKRLESKSGSRIDPVPQATPKPETTPPSTPPQGGVTPPPPDPGLPGGRTLPLPLQDTQPPRL